jgi:hypothetical protein
LQEQDVETARINSLCNFCFLPADSNNAISDQPPSDYVLDLVPAGRWEEILDANLLPTEREVYEADDYDRFLPLRAGKVLEYLQELAG